MATTQSPMTSDQSPLEALFLRAQQAQRKALQARRRKLARQARAKPVPEAIGHEPRRTARQQTGDHYEREAWHLVQQAGCQLLGRQLTCPLGELDLVVREGATLVFIEVRQRATRRVGGGVHERTRRGVTSMWRTC